MAASAATVVRLLRNNPREITLSDIGALYAECFVTALIRKILRERSLSETIFRFWNVPCMSGLLEGAAWQCRVLWRSGKRDLRSDRKTAETPDSL
jgi:hypothetical protein